MNNKSIDSKGREMVQKAFSSLEKHLDCDLLTIWGDLVEGMETTLKILSKISKKTK